MRTTDLTGAAGWIQANAVAVSGSTATAYVTDTPPAGTFLYGAHLVDNTGQYGTEPSTVQATISQANYSFAVNSSGSGTVTSTDGYINCGSNCTHNYASGTTVTLNAAPSSGWSFSGWSGACSGTGSCSVTVASSLTVLATFTQNTVSYALTVSTSGSGTVTSTDGYINCGSSCTHSYTSGTDATLNAVPASGWSFSGWGGACSGTGSCVVTMNAAKTATATFTQNSYSLTVTTSGSGTVTSTDGYVNCGSSCTHPYASGTGVTLSAAPASGWNFSGWSGSCSGTGSCTVTMNSAATASATFTQNATSYALIVSAIGSGTVTSTDGYISCGSSCTHTYTSGTGVTLNAAPTSGWSFSGWGGACSGTGACTLTMSAVRSVSATFTQNAVNYTLTVSASGGGTVSSTDGYINCGSSCSHTYTSGTSVTLRLLQPPDGASTAGAVPVVEPAPAP